MKYLTLFCLLFSSLFFAQAKEEIKDIKTFQKDLNKEYTNSKTTPLRDDNFKKFKKHPFFPINLKYRIVGDFVKTKNASPFEIPTSSGKTKQYKEYGKVTFQLDGKFYTLTLYQSLSLMTQKGYEDYLFLPFRDETNGKETYGGGKYMDLKIPSGNKIILDFNKSYHPFCAYNAHDYSCPIVPEENKLPIRIEAGVKYEDIWFEH